MKGYWVAHVAITDADLYAAYRADARPALDAAGAVIRILGGDQETVAGKQRPHTVVVEFPSYKAAHDCYFGAAYQATIAKRDAGAEVDLTIVEGFNG